MNIDGLSCWRWISIAIFLAHDLNLVDLSILLQMVKE